MTEIPELKNLMEDLDDQLSLCTKCGMCQAVCPLFIETGHEADVARGKMALLEGLRQEMFKDPDGVMERLKRCLLCGSCSKACPSGVSAVEVFIKARLLITGVTGLPAASRLLLRGMLARPELFDRLMGWGARFQKLLIKEVNEVPGTSCTRFGFPVSGKRHIKQLASVPFHREVSLLDKPPGKSGLKVAFFVGCLLDKIYPETARSVIKVLDYHGVGIFMPDNQGCCGIPPITLGEESAFNKLLKHNLERFEQADFDYMVTACATCTTTIKKIWPFMVQKQPDHIRSQVNRLAEKTVDISSFLVSNFDLKENATTPDEFGTPLTYHDPCHLAKSLSVKTDPRILLGKNRGYKLNEMREPESCCGMGGSFNLFNYDESSDIGNRKCDHILESGCRAVATGCPACMMQISDMLSKRGEKVAVRHFIDIYAESLI